MLRNSNSLIVCVWLALIVQQHIFAHAENITLPTLLVVPMTYNALSSSISLTSPCGVLPKAAAYFYTAPATAQYVLAVAGNDIAQCGANRILVTSLDGTDLAWGCNPATPNLQNNLATVSLQAQQAVAIYVGNPGCGTSWIVGLGITGYVAQNVTLPSLVYVPSTMNVILPPGMTSPCGITSASAEYAFTAPVAGTYVFTTNPQGGPTGTCNANMIQVLTPAGVNIACTGATVLYAQLTVGLQALQQVTIQVGNNACTSGSSVSLAVNGFTAIPGQGGSSIAPVFLRGQNWSPTSSAVFSFKPDVSGIFQLSASASCAATFSFTTAFLNPQNSIFLSPSTMLYFDSSQTVAIEVWAPSCLQGSSIQLNVQTKSGINGGILFGVTTGVFMFFLIVAWGVVICKKTSAAKPPRENVPPTAAAASGQEGTLKETVEEIEVEDCCPPLGCCWFTGSPFARAARACAAVWVLTVFIFASAWGAYWSAYVYVIALIVSIQAFVMWKDIERVRSGVADRSYIARHGCGCETIFIICGMIMLCGAATAIAQVVILGLSMQRTVYSISYASSSSYLVNPDATFFIFGVLSIIPDLFLAFVCFELARMNALMTAALPAAKVEPEQPRNNNCCTCCAYDGRPGVRAARAAIAIWVSTFIVFVSAWGSYWSAFVYFFGLAASILAFTVWSAITNEPASATGKDDLLPGFFATKNKELLVAIFVTCGACALCGAAVALGQAGYIGTTMAELTSIGLSNYGEEPYVFLAFGVVSAAADIVLAAFCFEIGSMLHVMTCTSALAVIPPTMASATGLNLALMSKLERKHIMVSACNDSIVEALHTSFLEKELAFWTSGKYTNTAEREAAGRGAIEQASHFVVIVDSNWLDSIRAHNEFTYANQINDRFNQPEIIPVILPDAKGRLDDTVMVDITKKFKCHLVQGAAVKDVVAEVELALASSARSPVQVATLAPPAAIVAEKVQVALH